MLKQSNKNFIFSNLQLFKNTYKLNPPQEVSWGALGSQLKIEQMASIQPSIDQHPWSEQISSNPFIKTKQLFKNKNQGNSVIEDDMTNEHIFTSPKAEMNPQDEQGKNFQFDSFGVHNNNEQPKLIQQYPSNTSSQDIKAWNSSSVEINFGKIQKEELVLPIKQPDNLQLQNDFIYDITQNNDSSIKQFCFKLNQTSEISLQNTPVKKWSEIKQLRQKKNIKQGQPKKATIKKIILDFMEKLDYIPAENITQQFIKNTKVLLDKVGQKQSLQIPLRQRINQSLQTSKRKTRINDDENSTLRLYTEESSKVRKTQRKEKNESAQYHYKGKFRVYECRSKNKQNKNTPIKHDKKIGNKDKRFKF